MPTHPAALLALLALGTTSPESPANPLVRVADTSRELGTSYEVVLVVPENTTARARADLAAARDLCRTLEARLSEWSETSEISRVNRLAGRKRVALSPDLSRILAGSAQVWRVTEGAFDPTWRALAGLWDDAAERDAWPDSAAVADARAHVGFDRIVLDSTGVRFADPGVRLGIAGVAKGWIIDAIFRFLRRRGHSNVLVNVGGDLRVAGTDASGRANVISLLDPASPERVALEVPARETAIATSGSYFRRHTVAGRRVGHILDPRTGYPATFDGSVTVFAPDAAMADALATGLFVLGPEAGLALARALDGVEAIYLTRDGVASTIDTLVAR